jgi:signal transduction histidine kinase/ActR/RegA family two-component response regulator
VDPLVNREGGTVDAAAASQAVRSPRTGLVARLFALVILAILPALAVQAYNEVELRRSREAEVRQEALRLAKFAAGEVDRIVENGRGLLVALSNLPVIRNPDRAACTAYLQSLRKAFPQYLAMGAIDLTGQPFCASEPIPAGANMADRSYFKQTIETGEFTIGHYVTGRLIGRPVLPLMLPFRGLDGRIAGVVYVSLDPQWLAEYFQTSKPLGLHATLAITDRNAVVIARIPDNERYAGTRFASVYDKHVFAAEPATDEIVGVDGVTRILGYVPVNYPPTIGLYVGVGLTTADAFAAVNRATIAGFLLITSGLVLGLVVARIGARQLLFRPIERLVSAAAQWSHGNFAARAVVGSGSRELTELGRTFDQMAALLQDQQQENATLLTTLENRVEERTEALEVSNRALRAEMQRREQAEEALHHAQKLEALGQLTGGIAHDFNNTLHVILGNLSMVERRLEQGSSDRRRLIELIQSAIRAGERTANSTRQLLAFGRRQPLRPRPVDINRLLCDMRNLLQRTLGEQVKVDVVLGARVWKASVDLNELANALINLAVNARDAMPAGGTLTIETDNTYLDATYAAAEEDVVPGQYVVISVSDTGFGMSREILGKAFEPFFTTKDVGEGSGLGLSQVYGFIKQSGGHAKIYSKPDKGTTVKLYLPRLPSSAKADPEEQPAAVEPARAGNGQVVLVVEDEPEVRDYAVMALRELGYGVVEADDGQEALRVLTKNRDVKLLFTDIGLPDGFNGLQLAREALRRRPDLKLLYTTGYARDAIVHQDHLDPDVELLLKPFTYAEFADAVRKALCRR